MEFNLIKERRKLFNPVFLPLNGYDKKTMEEIEKIIEMQDKEFIKLFKQELRNCDEFFNVKDYNDVHTTDKFMGIVELFLNKLAGEY